MLLLIHSSGAGAGLDVVRIHLYETRPSTGFSVGPWFLGMPLGEDVDNLRTHPPPLLFQFYFDFDIYIYTFINRCTPTRSWASLYLAACGSPSLPGFLAPARWMCGPWV